MTVGELRLKLKQFASDAIVVFPSVEGESCLQEVRELRGEAVTEGVGGYCYFVTFTGKGAVILK